MTFLIFLASLAAAVFVFEIASALQSQLFRQGSLLDGASVDAAIAPIQRRTTLDAILVAIWPERFDPERSRSLPNVIEMLRRAGYPYATPGEFYAAAVRDFGLYLTVGGLLAGAMVIFDMAFAAPLLAAMFIYMGLRRPYARLKQIAKKRAEGMLNNMLIALATMESLVAAAVSVQDALRRVGTIGGPFCNLIMLLVAQMDNKGIHEAISVVRAHLPDPEAVEPNLFLQDILDHFTSENPRPLHSSIQALRLSVHRAVVEATEARAALVRQRAGLFGGLAVFGMVMSIVLPYLGALF